MDSDYNNSKIEDSVIGGILLDSVKALDILLSVGCEPSWFDDTKYCKLYESMMERHIEGRITDPIIAKRISDIPARDLDYCIDACITIAHFPYYVDIFRKDYMKRQSDLLVNVSKCMMAKADPVEIRDTITSIRNKWDELLSGEKVENRNVYEVGVEVVDKWENHQEDDSAKIYWPIPELDRVIGPIEKDLIWIVAKESVGKTAFVLQLAIKSAMSMITVSLKSLESKIERIVPRLIGSIGAVNTQRLRVGQGSDEEFKRARGALETLDGLPLSISDTPSTIDQLLAWGRAEKTKGSKMLIIDNMRHIRTSQKYSNPVAQMRDISIRLKAIRDDLDMPVVVLHHSNKEGDDVSWSQDIKRDADILIYLRNNEDLSDLPTQENNYSGRCIIDCDIDKNRDGAAGIIVTAQFIKKFQQFEDYTAF